LLALRAVDRVSPVATAAAVLPFVASARALFALALRPLLPLLSILARLLLLALRAITSIMRAPRPAPGRCRIRRRWWCDAFRRRSCRRGYCSRVSNLCLLLALWTAGPMGTPVGTTSRSPDLDESRLLLRCALTGGNCISCNIS
jgi:hypothetical protein